MAECEVLRICVFFGGQMMDMPSTAEALKHRYCLGDNAQCARFMVYKALGKRKVPPNLLPNQTRRALTTIQSG